MPHRALVVPFSQKKLGLRYLMDVVPLEPERVKGSHGLRAEGEDGPVVIGKDPPEDMKDFKAYVRRLLGKD